MMNGTICDSECYSEINILKRKIKYLEQEVNTYKYDYLTGLLTRIDFEKKFKEYVEDHNRFNKPFTLSIVDVNDLHNININSGYDIGDKRIVEVSLFLQETFVHSDIYRIGGDEFAILCRSTSADKTLENISSANLYKHISIGSVRTKDLEIVDISNMFKECDDSLLKDKKMKKVGRLHRNEERLEK